MSRRPPPGSADFGEDAGIGEDTDSGEDATTIIGLRSATAVALTVVFLMIAGVVTVGSRLGQDEPLGPPMASLLLLAVGATLVSVAPGDPLPPRTTAVVAVIPALQVAVMWPVLPTTVAPDPMLLAPTVGGGAVVCTILAVRGRVATAWGAQAASGVVFGAWTATSGLPPQLLAELYLSNAGIMAVATYFAWVMRPAAAAVFGLRSLRTRSAASVAAAEGARREREAQTARIDEIARPLLSRIASGANLSDEEIAQTVLLEARLRDSIRARVLDVPVIVQAVWNARRRGVTVQLFDEGGLDPEAGPGLSGSEVDGVLDRLATTIVEVLDAMNSGRVTVRVQPPGRTELAVITRSVDDEVTRIEFTRPTG